MRALAPATLLLLPAAATAAETYERPPSFNAAQIPGIKRVGSNYTVLTPVRSDGLLRLYVVTTPYGKFNVQGDEMMRMRQNELYALARLEKVSNSESFGKALAEAGLSPLVFAGKLITNPVDTVQSTFAGVGNFFGRIGSGLNNAGKTQDDAMAGLLGVTDQRRQIAAAYGVDPYTDFPPLDAELKRLAEASTAGGLVVSGALMAVPGAAGIVVSNLSTANKLNDIGIDQLARDYTAAQILALNKKRLIAMNISPDLSDRLLANRDFTPIDMAAMVAALDSMKGVGGREIFVQRAAEAHPRYVAYFVRRQAELLADGYHHHAGYTRFVSLGGDPVMLDRKGHLVAVAPIDALSWTKDTAGGLGHMTSAGRQTMPKASGELRMPGTATALAKKALKKERWTVREHTYR